MKANIYTCKGITEATDKANIFYINASTARKITNEERQIKVLNRKGEPLAIFAY